MMKRLALALTIACLLALLPFKVAMADESSVEGQAIVLLGLTVKAPLSVTGSIGNEAQAKGRYGEAIPVSGGAFSLGISGWKGTVTLPLRLTGGQTLASFTDPASGLEISEGKFTLSLKDSNGNKVLSIHGDIEEIQGDGDTTEVVVKNMVLKSEEMSVDFSPADDEVGDVSASFDVQLRSLPEGAFVETSISKEPDEDSLRSFQLVAKASDMVVADIAYTLNVEKTNLDNETNLGEGVITMKVGRAWAEGYGVDNVQIMRRTESGECQTLHTTFKGFDGDQAVFQAVSPGGLSVFGLAAIIPLSPTSTIWIPIVGGVGGGGSIGAFLVFFTLRRRRAREAALRRRWPTGMKPEDWTA